MFRLFSKILKTCAHKLYQLRKLWFRIFWFFHRELDEKTARSLFYIYRHGCEITLNNLPTYYLNAWAVTEDYPDFCNYTRSLIADYERYGLLGTSAPYAVMCYTRHRYWRYGVSKSHSYYYHTAFRYSREICSTREINFQFLLELQELLWVIRDARAQGIQLPNARLFDIDNYIKIMRQVEPLILGFLSDNNNR